MILTLDTSTATLTIALVDGDIVVGEYAEELHRNHSIRLHPAIEQLMESKQVSMNDLTAIAVGSGPGSYTGIRIAVATAKTIGWALSIPVVDVSSLEILASVAANQAKSEAIDKFWVVPFMNARRGNVYSALFEGNREGKSDDDNTDERLIRRLPDEKRLMRTFLDELESLWNEEKPDRVYFIGDIDLFQEEFQAVKDRGKFAESISYCREKMQARYAASLAQEALAKGEIDSVHTLVPNYTQLAEVELKFKARNE